MTRILTDAAVTETRRQLPVASLAAFLIAAATTGPAAAQNSQDSTSAVRATLTRYKTAIEQLDGRQAQNCFAPDSQVFESGSAEGSFERYLEHHLGPELKDFRSFRFSNYVATVRFEGQVALASETYGYTIVTKAGETVQRQGVATSVLKKSNGRWQIIVLHTSGRRPTPPKVPS